MGTMADIGMPVGLTFAGRAYDDSALLRFAYAFEVSGARRTVPSRTPGLLSEPYVGGEPSDPDRALSLRSEQAIPGGVQPLVGDALVPTPGSPGCSGLSLALDASATVASDLVTVTVTGSADAAAAVALFVNGEPIPVTRDGDQFFGAVELPRAVHEVVHSEWRRPYGSIVTAVVRDASDACVGGFAVVGGIA
jgi:amidase